MLQPKREIGGQLAVIYAKAVEDEGTVARHFCPDHRQAASPAVNLGPQIAQATGGQYGSLSVAGGALCATAQRSLAGRP
jgi:hypothetical protein